MYRIGLNCVLLSLVQDTSSCRGEGKGKAVPVLFLIENHAMKAYWGSGWYNSTHFLFRHYMEVSDQIHAPDALPLGKELPVVIV
jgi:hypothetical protein